MIRHRVDFYLLACKLHADDGILHIRAFDRDRNPRSCLATQAVANLRAFQRGNGIAVNHKEHVAGL